MADGIRPFQLVLLAADKGDILDNERAGPTDYRNARLGVHPIVASAHIGFTCLSNTDSVGLHRGNGAGRGHP